MELGRIKVDVVGSRQGAPGRAKRPYDRGAEATPLAGPRPKQHKQVSREDCIRLNTLILFY